MRDDSDRRMKQIARELREPVALDGDLEARVMRAVHAMPRHRRFGLWSRLTSPRTVTVKPISWGLLAATIALLAGVGATRTYDVLHRTALPTAGALLAGVKTPSSAQPVQFVLVARDAKKVSVVGDFNGWNVSHAKYQAQHRGGGVWAVTAKVPLGHHRYSFVVDDSVWVADPSAPRDIDNDFGLANSAIVVQK